MFHSCFCWTVLTLIKCGIKQKKEKRLQKATNHKISQLPQEPAAQKWPFGASAYSQISRMQVNLVENMQYNIKFLPIFLQLELNFDILEDVDSIIL